MKKRLKLSTGAPLIMGVILIIYVALGLVYFKGLGESRALASEINLMSTTLQKPQPNIEELKARLNDADAKSQAILASLPNPNQGIDIDGALVDLGASLGVRVVQITTSAAIMPKDGKMGETVLPYLLSINGSRDGVLSFISGLMQQTKLLQGLELKNVKIQNSNSPDGTENASLEIWVHTWPKSALETSTVSQASGSKK